MLTSSFKPPHVSSESDLPSGAVVWKVESRAISESSLSEDVISSPRGTPSFPGIAKDTPQAGAVDDCHTEYKCNKCNIVLRSQERLERHHYKLHAKAKCDKCNVVLCSSKRLARHLRKVHGVATKSNNSTSTFKRNETLNPHEAAKCFPTHYECDECDSVFLSAELLAAHNQDAHPSFKCVYCENTFRSLEERNLHQTGHLTHLCDSCDWAFYTLEALEHHKRDRHDLYCHYCSQYFTNIVLRDQHEFLTHKCSTHPNSEALQRHKDASHSLGPSVASTSQIPVGRSSSGSSSGLSVVDDSSLSSPSTVYQSDLLLDFDAELLESRSASGSQASMDPELSENIWPTVTHGTQSLYRQFPGTDLFSSPRNSRKWTRQPLSHA